MPRPPTTGNAGTPPDTLCSHGRSGGRGSTAGGVDRISVTTAHDLEGKVALIIGGTRNQGAEFAKDIAARGAVTIATYQGNEQAAKDALAALEQLGGAAGERT